MTLRRIEPLSVSSMRGIVPASIPADYPVLEWVAPAELFVDGDYQRSLRENSIALIRRIVTDWDWAHVKPVICAVVDGRKEVIDGQHTAISAATLGIPFIPAMIVDRADAKHRARAFLAQNRDRVALTSLAMHRAAVAAGDEAAIASEKACAKAGAIILPFPPSGAATERYKVGETVAVGTITRLAKAAGIDGCARVLAILIAATRAPLAADEIGAVALLLHDVAWRGRFADEAIATALRSGSPMEWMAKAAARRAVGTPARRALAEALAGELKPVTQVPSARAPSAPLAAPAPKLANEASPAEITAPAPGPINARKVGDDKFAFEHAGGTVTLDRGSYLVAERLRRAMGTGILPRETLARDIPNGTARLDAILFTLKRELRSLGLVIEHVKGIGLVMKRASA